MEENQLGSIVECYLTGDDDKDVSNIQNDNSSEDPFNEEQQKRKVCVPSFTSICVFIRPQKF